MDSSRPNRLTDCFINLALILVLTILADPIRVNAAISPVSVALIPPLELPTDTFTVIGARVSLIYGRQKSVYGFDFGGLGNVTYVGFGGIAVSGLFNVTHGMTEVVGLQAAGLTNINTNITQIIGFQVAGLFNSNSANCDLNGIQLALANVGSRQIIRGMQVGLFNSAASVYGIQLGVLNLAHNVHGLQIGLMNFNESGIARAFPIINGGF